MSTLGGFEDPAQLKEAGPGFFNSISLVFFIKGKMKYEWNSRGHPSPNSIFKGFDSDTLDPHYTPESSPCL